MNPLFLSGTIASSIFYGFSPYILIINLKIWSRDSIYSFNPSEKLDQVIFGYKMLEANNSKYFAKPLGCNEKFCQKKSSDRRLPQLILFHCLWKFERMHVARTIIDKELSFKNDCGILRNEHEARDFYSRWCRNWLLSTKTSEKNSTHSLYSICAYYSGGRSVIER